MYRHLGSSRRGPGPLRRLERQLKRYFSGTVKNCQHRPRNKPSALVSRRQIQRGRCWGAEGATISAGAEFTRAPRNCYLVRLAPTRFREGSRLRECLNGRALNSAGEVCGQGRIHATPGESPEVQGYVLPQCSWRADAFGCGAPRPSGARRRGLARAASRQGVLRLCSASTANGCPCSWTHHCSSFSISALVAPLVAEAYERTGSRRGL